MIAGFAIITLAIYACLGIYQVMKDRDAKSQVKPKVYPLSDDDMALWEHDLGLEALKIAELRSTREASRKCYEYTTWPAICWAYRGRQIDSENIRERAHQTNNGAASR